MEFIVQKQHRLSVLWIDRTLRIGRQLSIRHIQASAIDTHNQSRCDALLKSNGHDDHEYADRSIGMSLTLLVSFNLVLTHHELNAPYT